MPDPALRQRRAHISASLLRRMISNFPVGPGRSPHASEPSVVLPRRRRFATGSHSRPPSSAYAASCLCVRRPFVRATRAASCSSPASRLVRNAEMKRALSIADFVRAPIGCYSVGTTHLVWCHSPTLCGTVHWGRPTENDATELVQRLEASMHPLLAERVDALVDARATRSFNANAFVIVSRYVQSRLSEWQRRLHRHAVVVSADVVGAVIAGLLPMLGPKHAVQSFLALDEATAWLGRDDLDPVLDEVRHLAEDAQGTPPLIRVLRDHLDASLIGATLETTAGALGLSARSLQRLLRRHGTGFSQELAQARVRVALSLLEAGDARVETIAHRVGCYSSSQLSAIFRRYTGSTPSRYRFNRRATTP
jgi:AraC-like DNA-binding protein